MDSSGNGNHDDAQRRDRLMRILARAREMGIPPERVAVALELGPESSELLERLDKAPANPTPAVDAGVPPSGHTDE